MQSAARRVVERLQAAGFETYWVGGCVRDLLWGLEPSDYDVATAAQPDDIAKLFESTREVGRSFGVVRVRSDGAWIEVATFRTEGEYRDGRHPESVTFADAQRDALRRDFTINALFMDPITGTIVDHVGGQDDLNARRLRCVGDPAVRFGEDALRLLRAVRFASGYGLEIEASTEAAMRAHAERVQHVAAERVGDEFLSILAGPNKRRAMTLLRDSGLLQQIAPELMPLQGCQQSPRDHPEGDVWEHTLRMLAMLKGDDSTLALGVLLHDVGKPATRSVDDRGVHFYAHEVVGQEIATQLMRRLRLPGRTQAEVRRLIAQHLRFMQAAKMKRSTLRRFVLQPSFPRLLELHRLDALASSGDLTGYELCLRERKLLEREPAPLRPLLSGHDLIERGYPPGPQLGRMLRALVDAQLAAGVRDREGALRWIETEFGAPGETSQPDT